MSKQEPIRIAHIIGKWVGGGVEAVVMNYYRHIDYKKIQFDFICDNDSTNIPYKEIEKLGGKVILIPPYQKIFQYQKELKKIFKENNYRIVHSHINTLSVFPLFAAWIARVPVRIAHSHSTTNNKEKKKNLMKQVLRPFAKVFANNYVCCSELAGRWLFGNKTYEKGKVFLLNNAIDLNKYKYDEKVRNAKRKELGIKKNQVVIGHIGRFVQQKNHTFLIDIFNEIHKKNKNAILLLAGQGPLARTIKAKVKKLELEDSVVFLGQRNDANELYQAFDIFLLPSLYEGLPVVGVEAQAAGLLCILSSDMTKETKVLKSTTFVDLTESSEQWANIILEKYESYTRIDTTKEISKNGFNIEKESKKLEIYYNKFISYNITYILPDFSIGGAEKMVSLISSNLNKSYFHPSILLIKSQKENNLEKETINKINSYFLGKKNGLNLKIFFKAYNQLKLWQPSIIHTNLQSFLYVLPYAILNNIKIIHTIHCEPYRDGTKIHRRILKFLIRRKKIVPVAISDVLGEKTKEYYNTKSCNVIYNPVDTNIFKMKKVNKKNNEITKFVSVGRLVKEKNHKLLIHGFIQLRKKYPNISLDIIGDGYLKEELSKTIIENNASGYIKLLGEKNNIEKHLNNSDIFVLTSTTEGMPMTILEAMSCGKPILSSAVGGVPDIIKDNGLLFESNNMDDFINKASKMLENPQSINEMSAKSIELANKYDILNIVSQYEKLYADYIKR